MRELYCSLHSTEQEQEVVEVVVVVDYMVDNNDNMIIKSCVKSKI